MHKQLLNLSLSLGLLILCSSASAEWGLVGGLSGYQGTYYGGGAFRSINENHSTDLTVGMSPGIMGGEVYQLNIKYGYSPFRAEFTRFSTNVMGIGFLLTRCLCEDTFVKNASIYPENNYYDETAYRTALTFSTRVQWKDLEFYWDWLILDQILIAAFNNPGMKAHPFEHWSAGLGIRLFTDF